MIIPKRVEKFYYLGYPKIVAMITSGTFENSNVMPATWNTPVSMDPPLFAVAVAPIRFTFKLIEEHGEFGLNFLPFEKAELVYKAGYTSGKDVDKFEELGLTRIKAKKIKAPLLSEAITAIECKVINKVETGDHVLFVCEVLQTWVNPDYVDKDGRIVLAKVSPVYHIGRKRFVKIDPDSLVDFEESS